MENIDFIKTENPETPRIRPAMIYALVLSAIGIVFMIAGHFTGWDMQSWSYRIVSWIISIGGILFIVKHFRDEHNKGRLRFGQGVGLSSLTGLFAGLITAVFFYFFISYIAPEFMTNIQDQAINDMMEKGMSEEQIEQNMQYAGMFMSAGFMSIMALVGTVVSYTILGLIASAIFKRD